MADPAGALLSLAASFILLLLAAKAHGRQVRLERETRGYHRVDFTADNSPWVEALWARDRRTYWGTAGLAAVGLLAARFGPWGAPLPLPLGAPADAWVDAALVLAWAGFAAFTVAGLASLARLLREAPARARTDESWASAALGGSAFWWAINLGGCSLFWSLAAYAA